MTEQREWTGRVFIGTSLDGYIARIDGSIDWLTDPAPGPVHADITTSSQVAEWDTFFPSVDHLVMGRGTYEKVLTFDGWPYDGKRVIVMSTSLDTDDDRITIARTLDEAVEHLATGSARQVYVDGGKAIQSFLRADLIDEINIGWAPVLIGSGLSLFGLLGDDVQLALIANGASKSGMVHTTHHVHRRKPVPERS